MLQIFLPSLVCVYVFIIKIIFFFFIKTHDYCRKSDNVEKKKKETRTIPPIPNQLLLTPWSTHLQMIFYIDTSWDFFFFNTNVTVPYCFAILYVFLHLIYCEHLFMSLNFFLKYNDYVLFYDLAFYFLVNSLLAL